MFMILYSCQEKTNSNNFKQSGITIQEDDKLFEIGGDVKCISLICYGGNGKKGIISAKNSDYIQIVEIIK